MSILSFLPANISWTASGPKFGTLGVSYFSSSSVRIVSALSQKNPEVKVVDWVRNRIPYKEFRGIAEMEMLVRHAEKQAPRVPHWRFCFMTIRKEFGVGTFYLHQLAPELRNAVCVMYLVLHALDAVEDDTSIATEVKVPILRAFHRFIYDRESQFACGSEDYKILINKFHHVSTAFLELGNSYRNVIEDVTMRTGAGMAKFICKEVETIDDYDDYCHYVAGLIGVGLSNLFRASGIEDLPSSDFFHASTVFLQKADIIADYLEDINEMPKSRMFWPRQIWSKYVDTLEDLKYEQNSVKALHCLNDMVTNALMHAEECLKGISAVGDQAIFQGCALQQLVSIGVLAWCYNNIQVFRGVETLPASGVTTEFLDGTKTISNYYKVFYDLTCKLKSKIDDNDPNATETKERVETILRLCRNSTTLQVI